MADDTTTGGTPGAGGTPAQAGQQQQSPTAGGTPAAGSTTTTQGKAGGTPDQPEDVTGLKNALRTERQSAAEQKARADAAESELTKLRQASLTDQEKAVDAARREGAAEVRTLFEARIRRAEIRTALTAAGITASELDLASGATEFASLKVGDDGVAGLSEAVDAFKKAHPALFGASKPALPAAPTGSADAGTRSGITDLRTQAAQALDQGDYKTSIALKTRRLREVAAGKG